MGAAVSRPLPQPGERILSLAEQLDSPCVVVDYAAGASTWARSEILDAPHGPSAAAVVRSVARCLAVQPGALDAEPEAVFPGDPEPDHFHVIVAGRRVAVVHGMDLDAFIDAVIALGVTRAKRGDA